MICGSTRTTSRTGAVRQPSQNPAPAPTTAPSAPTKPITSPQRGTGGAGVRGARIVPQRSQNTAPSRSSASQCRQMAASGAVGFMRSSFGGAKAAALGFGCYPSANACR
jgi:hypothetical protein